MLEDVPDIVERYFADSKFEYYSRNGNLYFKRKASLGSLPSKRKVKQANKSTEDSSSCITPSK